MRINEFAFLDASLTARQQVYREPLEDIIKRYKTGKSKLATAGDNTKLGNTVDAFKFPAHFSCRPGITCDGCRFHSSMNPDDYKDHTKARKDGFCYAMKGKQAFKSSQVSYWRQYRLLTEAPAVYKEIVARQVAARAIEAGTEYVRFFDTGDNFSSDCMDALINTAECNKGLQHMFFTKWHERLNAAIESGELSLDNVTPIISDDTGVNVHDDVTVNPNHLPIAIVIHAGEEITDRLPGYIKNYHVCPGTKTGCDACGRICWKLQLEEAVIFHEH